MKMLFIPLSIILSLGICSQIKANVVESETINVDGYLHNDELTNDGELTQIQSEIKRQKEEILLNRAKAKGFQQLSKSVEKLSETTVEYLEEKKAAQQEIANYNMKVKCLQAEDPGPECNKFVRKK